MKKPRKNPQTDIVVNYAKRKWKVFAGDNVFEVKSFEEAIRKRKEMEKVENSLNTQPSSKFFTNLFCWVLLKLRHIAK